MAVKNIQRRSIHLTREVLKDLKTVSRHLRQLCLLTKCFDLFNNRSSKTTVVYRSNKENPNPIPSEKSNCKEIEKYTLYEPINE